jgi:hypothetical protein
MEINDTKRLSDSIERIQALNIRLHNEVLDDNTWRKFALMFAIIVLDIHRLVDISKFIGIDELEKISTAQDLIELSQFAWGSPLFELEFDETDRNLMVITEAWREHSNNFGIMMDEFLRDCIIGITERSNPLDPENRMKVDLKRRQELCLKFGIEV